MSNRQNAYRGEIAVEDALLVGVTTNILIVDDDPEFGRMLSVLLGLYGFRSRYTGVAGAAQQIAARERPDLIVLDYFLPGTDGLSVARQLRASPATAHIPLLLLTAASDAPEMQALTESDAGIVAVVCKGTGLRELARGITRALSRGHTRRTSVRIPAEAES